MPVVNEFHSIVDGSPFSLDVGDDSDAAVYRRIGGTMSYGELCEAMITVSSNFASNLLIERLGAKRIQATVDGLGAPGMHVLRGVEDDKAFRKGLNNTTTARALMTLLVKLANGDAVDRNASQQMVAVLRRQTFNDRIPAGLPPNTAVAHKTGEITQDSARRRHRVCEASVRAGRARARPGGSEGRLEAHRGHHARAVRRVATVKDWLRGRVPLNRALSKLGILSRARATTAIRGGRVRVNGRVETNPLRLVVPERAAIDLDGARETARPWRTILSSQAARRRDDPPRSGEAADRLRHRAGEGGTPTASCRSVASIWPPRVCCC